MAVAPTSSILGIDLDGCVDEAPEFYRTLSHIWPGRVVVITLRDDEQKAAADLRRFGVRYDELVLVDRFAEKADVIARLKISVFIDDQDEVLQHIPETVTILKMRNGGNFDFSARKWLYSQRTGRPV